MGILRVHDDLESTDYWPNCKRLIIAYCDKFAELPADQPYTRRYHIEGTGIKTGDQDVSVVMRTLSNGRHVIDRFE